MGHIMRCRALAKVLTDRGWDCYFAVSPASRTLSNDIDAIVVPAGDEGALVVREMVAAKHIDCLVVDHYGLDAQFECTAGAAARLVLVIDDLANRTHHCNLLVDLNPGRTPADYAGRTPASTRLLLGPRHALLRAEFAERHATWQGFRQQVPIRLIATLGGADPDNVSSRVIEALPALRRQAMKSLLVVAPSNPRRPELLARAASVGVEVAVNPPNLVALMADADIAISGGGTTCLEFACLGIPAVVIVVAENQRAIAGAVSKAGAADILDDRDGLDPRRLSDAVERIAQDVELRRRMTKAGRALVDGRGAARVADAIIHLAGAKELESRW